MFKVSEKLKTKKESSRISKRAQNETLEAPFKFRASDFDAPKTQKTRIGVYQEKEKSEDRKELLFAKKKQPVDHTEIQFLIDELHPEHLPETMKEKKKRQQKLLNKRSVERTDEPHEDEQITTKNRAERSTSKRIKIRNDDDKELNESLAAKICQNFSKKNSIESSKTVTCPERKLKVKPAGKNEQQKTKTINCQNQNSLKDLLTQFKLLKSREEKKLSLIDSINLDQMRRKLMNIQNVVQEKLGKIGFDSQRIQEAATIIQKYFRGHRARKEFKVLIEIRLKNDKLKEKANKSANSQKLEKNSPKNRLKNNQELVHQGTQYSEKLLKNVPDTTMATNNRMEFYTPVLHYKTIVNAKGKLPRGMDSPNKTEETDPLGKIAHTKIFDPIYLEPDYEQSMNLLNTGKKGDRKSPKNEEKLGKIGSGLAHSVDEKIASFNQNEPRLNTQKSGSQQPKTEIILYKEEDFPNKTNSKAPLFETPIESILNSEFKNWQQMTAVLDELKNVLQSKNETDTKFKSIVTKMSQMADINLKQIQKKIQEPRVPNLEAINSRMLSKSVEQIHNSKSVLAKSILLPDMTVKNKSVRKFDEAASIHISMSRKSFNEAWPNPEQIRRSASHQSIPPAQIFERLNSSELQFFVADKPNENGIFHFKDLKHGFGEVLANDSDLRLLSASIVNPKDPYHEHTKHLNLSGSKIPAPFMEPKSLIEIQPIYSGEISSKKGSPRGNTIVQNDSVVKQLDKTSRSIERNSALLEEFEYIEIPMNQLVNRTNLTENIEEEILEWLIYDLMDSPVWKPLVIKGILEDSQVAHEDNIYGIRTNISAVNEYCNLLIKFLEGKKDLNFRSFAHSATKTDSDFFIANDTALEPANSTCWKRKTSKNLVLTEVDYLTLEDQILENYKDMNIVDQLFEMQRVYHRCVFDSFNEILTLSLKNETRKKNKPKSDPLQDVLKWSDPTWLRGLLQRVKNQLLDNTLMLCGLIKDKEDSMMGKSVKNFDSETVLVIRKERLCKLTRHEMAEAFRRDELEQTQTSERKKSVLAVIDWVENQIFEDCVKFLGCSF